MGLFTLVVLGELTILAAFDATVRQAFVAEMMDNADYPNAVALKPCITGAHLVALAIVDVIIASIGIGWAFLFNDVFFLAVLNVLIIPADRRKGFIMSHPVKI